MTHALISRDALRSMLRDAVILHRNQPHYVAVSFTPLSSLDVHPLPSLDRREASGANWNWTCPGAPPLLLECIGACARSLQAQFIIG